MYPKYPDFTPIVGDEAKFDAFGRFDYKVLKGGDIDIQGNWVEENIITAEIPQLIGVKGAPHDGIITVHRLAEAPLKGAFAEIEAAELLDLVLTWDGMFYPRLIRGGTHLSNHSFGTAFDINAVWNPLGGKPALLKGTVLPLVSIFNKWGFFWGGHFKNRLDGMHVELAVIKV